MSNVANGKTNFGNNELGHTDSANDLNVSGDVKLSGTIPMSEYNGYVTTYTYTDVGNQVMNAQMAKDKAIEYLSNHEVTKKILSIIDDLASVGNFVLDYDYSDDYERGIWNSGIVDYFENVLEFDVDVNLNTKRFFVSWDLRRE